MIDDAKNKRSGLVEPGPTARSNEPRQTAKECNPAAVLLTNYSQYKSFRIPTDNLK